MTPESQQILNVQLVKVCLSNHVAITTLLAALVDHMGEQEQSNDLALRFGKANEALEKSASALNECINQLEKGSK